MYRYRDTEHIDITPVTETGGVVTIDNADDAISIQDLVADINPVQDLHGYDKPWAGGNGKNKLHNTATSATINGINFTVNADGTVTASGTATATVQLLIDFSGLDGDYYFCGCPTGGGGTKYDVYAWDMTAGGRFKQWDGTTQSLSDYGTYQLCQIKIPSGHNGRIVCRVFNGATVSGVMFKPMIVQSDVTDSSFEPYSNICPISGWDRVKIANMSDITNRQYFNGLLNGTYGFVDLGTLNYSYQSANGAFVVQLSTKKNGQQNILCSKYINSPRSSVAEMPDKTVKGNDNNNYINFKDASYNGDTSAFKTAMSGVYLIYELATPTTPTITEAQFNILLEQFDIDGKLYIIDLNGTRYGCTLDVTSGVLVVDRKIYRAGDLSQWDYTAGVKCFSGWLPTETASITQQGAPNCISSAYKHRYPLDSIPNMVSGEFAVNTSQMSQNNKRLVVKDYRYTSVSDFLADNADATFVIPLATPITVQLTPQEVDLLTGQNNVWASSGNIKVVYAVDLKKYITLPKEAVSINGTFLENIIEGYRTLYVKGRESLKSELDTYSVGTADGERIKGSRYPARELTVGFQLLCKSDSDFRIAFNQLNNILSIEEADFIFNDEPAFFFTGTPIMDASVEAGRNNVTGEWKIFCGFPFKRSVALTVLSSESDAVIDGNKATFTFTYNGSYPSKPLLRATFAGAKEGGDYNEDGDCGYIAFFDDEENIIQLGNPDVIDVDAQNKNVTETNSVFDSLENWTADGISIGSITDAFWNNGQGQTMNFAKGVGTLERNTSGAIGFDFDIVHRLCVSEAWQTGSFKALLKNGNTTVVGFVIQKTGAGTQAQVQYILNDKVVGSDNIDVGFYNTSFGYCMRTDIYTDQTYQQKVVKTVKKKKKKKKKTTYVTATRTVWGGYNYTQSNLNSGISRDGGVVTFSVGNLPARTFKNSAIAGVPVYDIVFETTGSFHTNAIRSVALIGKKGVPFAEIPNVFTAGDVVLADCSDANVYLYRKGSAEGHLEPQYGALGNDWEDFSIKAGTNVIAAAWSEWVDANYKPKIEIIFNEVNI